MSLIINLVLYQSMSSEYGHKMFSSSFYFEIILRLANTTKLSSITICYNDYEGYKFIIEISSA